MSKSRWLTLFLLIFAGCTSKATAPTASPDVQADVPAAQPDVTSADVAAAGPPTPAARGLAWSRNVVHIHSAFSHDACDNWITDHDGDVNQTCLLQLREGLCESGLDVAFMTDHPGRMKDHTFDELLFIHPELGDTPIGPAGQHHGNVIHCPKSATMPAHDLVTTVGYEGTHDLAVGLHGHFANQDLEGTSFADLGSLAEGKAAVAAIHEMKGLSLIAHSEEDDISVQRLVDLGIDGMEVYNTHANFKTIVGVSSKGATGNIGRVLLLDKLLGPVGTTPHPDLALMVMLDVQPEQAFLKWQAVNAQRRVTAVIGNDVHQNVVIPAFCKPMEGSICEGLQEDYPHLTKLLAAGGPIILADGKRIDHYTRLLRWVSNHTLLPVNTAVTERAEATKTAIRDGQTWAVFDALGHPEGMDWVAQDKATGKWVEAGGTVPLGSPLWVTLPTCVATPWAPWKTADTLTNDGKPTIQAVVWRIVAGQAVAQKLVTVSSATAQPGMPSVLKIVPDLPGRYHVELRITPRYLRPFLKGMEDFADKEQRWAVGNPIEVK